MGLIDLLRSYFLAPNQQGGLGPNDLPPDVLNDLNRGGSSHNHHHHHQPQQQPRDGSEHNFFHRGFHQQPRDNEQNFHQGFHHQHGSLDDIEEEFENAFRSMDQMFRGMFGFGRGGFGHGGFGHGGFGGFGDIRGGGFPESDGNDEDVFQGFFGSGPIIEYLPGDDESTQSDNQGKSLRDKMLNKNDNDDKMSPFKEKDDQFGTFQFKFGGSPFFGNVWKSPFDRQTDRQIDSDISSNEDQNLDGKSHQLIDEILNPKQDQAGSGMIGQDQSNDRSLFGIHERAPSNGFSSSSMFKSSSISKKINPDGSVETTTRKRDSNGNEEIITSRNIGDQTHTVTNRKNNAGEDERIESFVNMDENDLKSFEERWNSKTPRDIISPPDVFTSWWKPKL